MVRSLTGGARAASGGRAEAREGRDEPLLGQWCKFRPPRRARAYQAAAARAQPRTSHGARQPKRGRRESAVQRAPGGRVDRPMAPRRERPSPCTSPAPIPIRFSSPDSACSTPAPASERAARGEALVDSGMACAAAVVVVRRPLHRAAAPCRARARAHRTSWTLVLPRCGRGARSRRKREVLAAGMLRTSAFLIFLARIHRLPPHATAKQCRAAVTARGTMGRGGSSGFAQRPRWGPSTDMTERALYITRLRPRATSPKSRPPISINIQTALKNPSAVVRPHHSTPRNTLSASPARCLCYRDSGLWTLLSTSTTSVPGSTRAITRRARPAADRGHSIIPATDNRPPRRPVRRLQALSCRG